MFTTLRAQGWAEQEDLPCVPVPLHPHFFLKASRTSEIGLECYEVVNATGALDLSTQETKNQKQIEYLVDMSILIYYHNLLYIFSYPLIKCWFKFCKVNQCHIALTLGWKLITKA